MWWPLPPQLTDASLHRPGGGLVSFRLHQARAELAVVQVGVEALGIQQLLMGAALYVSFQGQATFSTAYEALQLLGSGGTAAPANVSVKTARARPVQQTRSEVETVSAAIKENVDGKDIIHNQSFERIRATLATVATSLSDDVPTYDPQAALAAIDKLQDTHPTAVSTDIYGADVEGDVAMHLTALPKTLVPPRVITDQAAADSSAGRRKRRRGKSAAWGARPEKGGRTCVTASMYTAWSASASPGWLSS